LSLRDPRYADCLNPNAELAGSNLDIKSWVDRRMLPLVVPIDGYEVLTEGYHKQVSVAAVKQAPTLAIHGNYAALEGVPKATAAVEQAVADVTYISKDVLPLAQKIGDVCTTTINGYQKDAITQEGAASDALAAAITAQAKGDTAGLAKSVDAAVAAQVIADARAKSAHDTIKDPKACMPPPKDPPLDLVSVNYQFEIAANIGIAPSWTLLRVTGPSGTGSAASTAGAWTNNLSIILAPEFSSTNPDVNTQRLIQTLRPPPAPAAAGSF
jgi:hypothetical protein